MEKVKLIILLFSITVFSQSDSATNDDFKSIEKIADSLFKNKNFVGATNYYEKLVKAIPNDFDYNFKYATSYGLYVESLPRLQQVKHIRQMINRFETAFNLKKDDIEINRALLEIYLRVPRFFGGGNKKAKTILDNIYSISVEEGKKSELFYNTF
tara:strand:+ start:3241 stop:3705 length:465 start_codon:yes stop_codon:yes gene_type:complete